MIYSYELEKQLLAALIKKPENYFEISAFINEKDFYSEDNSLNKTIFTIVRQALEAHEEIDDVIPKFTKELKERRSPNNRTGKFDTIR